MMKLWTRAFSGKNGKIYYCRIRESIIIIASFAIGDAILKPSTVKNAWEMGQNR
jgi:hypothetical protein